MLKNSIGTNRDFWIAKIQNDIFRDQTVNDYLENNGWTVLRYWAKDIIEDQDRVADEIISKISALKNSQNATV